MSKNYELLQQAQIGAVRLPGLQEEAGAFSAEGEAIASKQGLRVAEPAIDAEAMKLVQRLFLTSGDAAPKVVTFATVDSRNGCNWLCAKAAKALAESIPGSVCLIEADFRAPSLAHTLGVTNGRGLIDALRQEGSVKTWAKPIGPENLWLLSSGALDVDSLNLFNGERMPQRFSELRREFDYLLIQAPPLNAHADGLVLGHMSDGVVLVLEANATRREAALRATENLRNSRIPVLGAVLNNRTFPIPEALYKRI